MIAGPALAAWLASPPAQRRSQEAARAFAARWHADPVRRDLIARLDAAAGADAMVAAIEPLLTDIAWAGRMVAQLAAESAADPMFEPPFRSVDGKAGAGLVLVEHPKATIALTAVPLTRLSALKASQGRRSIGFSGELRLIRVIEPGGARIALWHADPPGPDFDLDTAPPCRPAGILPLERGTRLRLDGRCETYVIDAATSTIVLLQATVRGVAGPLLVEYDAGTRRATAVSATDGAASRVQLLTALAVAMRRRDAAPALRELAGDARFHVRWPAMRALAALDRPAARPLLADMAANDPQPAVRRAATATLEALCHA